MVTTLLSFHAKQLKVAYLAAKEVKKKMRKLKLGHWMTKETKLIELLPDDIVVLPDMEENLKFY